MQPPPAAHPPAHALRRLELKVVRRLDGLLHGDHLGLFPGPGSEPAEARPYIPGDDDTRFMDWNVTARTTTPHVRDLVADRELETWALVDFSASMDYGTATLEKRDLAVAALAAIGFLTTRMGDRFGVHLLHHGTTTTWPARSGRSHLHTLLHAITTTPRTPPATPDLPLSDGLAGLLRAHPRRGMRVIVSDFLDRHGHPHASRPWERHLRQLATRNQVLAIEIVDPRELQLPDVGLVTLTDPETGATREIHLSDKTRHAYAQAAAAQRAATRHALRRCGIPHLLLRTDRDWVTDIVGFVIRQRRLAHRLTRPTGANP